MYSTLSMKCGPYIKSSNRMIRGIYAFRRFKSDDGPPDDSDSKKTQAVHKLNDLLKSMVKGNDNPQISKSIELAKPRQMARKAEKKQEVNEEESDKSLGDKLAKAATSVAETMGGDVKKTESELLNLLRIYNDEPDNQCEKKPKSSVHLSELISGMKIDRSKPKAASSNYQGVDDKAQRVREILGSTSSQRKPFEKSNQYSKPMHSYEPINIFGSDPLNIFKNPDVSDNNVSKLQTWDRLQKKTLKLAVTHPPKNIYEQMIRWTEHGKLWTFPINNEQGMEDESKVFFADHVFLEPLLDDWCPKKGPIRHFMELVCVGLSKNPYFTVEEKRDHINWFRQYFYEKNQLLKEVGAFEIKSLPENVKEYYKPPVPEY
ncbi:28S ribosomal protein S31, mitochondrial [Adelges cooleyi]|uniref:28S ribosomal protein S31, mitochondrial n=1 Tax=Adelges cooleyi TaxID=133065 RepID=UPI00217F7007|nr:28S ribosomal protein S31, mitochondrial [Adelges cooleyi]